jgi:hypothetical protein
LFVVFLSRFQNSSKCRFRHLRCFCHSFLHFFSFVQSILAKSLCVYCLSFLDVANARISRLWLSNVLEPNLEGTGGMLVTQHSHKTPTSGLHAAALTQTLPTDGTKFSHCACAHKRLV